MELLLGMRRRAGAVASQVTCALCGPPALALALARASGLRGQIVQSTAASLLRREILRTRSNSGSRGQRFPDWLPGWRWCLLGCWWYEVRWIDYRTVGVIMIRNYDPLQELLAMLLIIHRFNRTTSYTAHA